MLLHAFYSQSLIFNPCPTASSRPFYQSKENKYHLVIPSYYLLGRAELCNLRDLNLRRSGLKPADRGYGLHQKCQKFQPRTKLYSAGTFVCDIAKPSRSPRINETDITPSKAVHRLHKQSNNCMHSDRTLRAPHVAHTEYSTGHWDRHLLMHSGSNSWQFKLLAFILLESSRDEAG